MPQPISHPANISPGLARHELLRTVTKPVRGLADPFNTAFDGIPNPFTPFKRLTVHAAEMACNPLRVLNDVVEAVRRIVLRRQ